MCMRAFVCVCVCVQVLDQLILGALDNGGYTSALPLWSINLVTR